jgi:threonine dehydrogenase-like Zn-dependent dehydrogenase
VFAFVFRDHQLQKLETPTPVAPPGEALIRVLYSGICNTDLEIIKGYMDFQGIIGHEFVGLVEKCEDPSLIGKRVVGEINCGCGKCEFCRKGLSRHCPNRTVLGIFGRNGAHAQYLTLPFGNLSTIPENVADRTAVFTEPLAAALEIFEQVHIKPNSNVAVIGDGKLGQLIALVLNQYPCNLTVIGKHNEKLNQLKRKNIAVSLVEQGEHPPQDIVVECSGVPDGLHIANSILKPRGTVVLKSTYHGDFPFNTADWIINEINVVGSRCGLFQPAIQLLKKDMIDLDYLVSAVVHAQDGLKAFELAQKEKTFKVLIDWQK